MDRRLVVSVPAAEAIRLCRILLDRDEGEALAFLEEHAHKRLHDFLEGG